MQVGHSPGHIVLDGDPASPPQNGAEPPNFRPMSVVTKWLHGLGLRYNLVWRYAALGPSDFVLDGDPAPDLKKGAEPPVFGPFLF